MHAGVARIGVPWPQHNVNMAEAWLFHCFGFYAAEQIAAMDDAWVAGRVGKGHYKYPKLYDDQPKYFTVKKLTQIKVGHWRKGANSKEIFVVSNLGDGDQTLDQLLRTEEVIDVIVQHLIASSGATKAEETFQTKAIVAKWCLKGEAFVAFLEQTKLIPHGAAEYIKRARHEMVSF